MGHPLQWNRKLKGGIQKSFRVSSFKSQAKIVVIFNDEMVSKWEFAPRESIADRD
jgi:hypothetical protein